MNRWVLLLLLIAAGIALLLRCPMLGLRPMHNDEGVNAVKFGQLWTTGVYQYDPNEHHGPTLIYATWIVERLTGARDRGGRRFTRRLAIPSGGESQDPADLQCVRDRHEAERENLQLVFGETE